VQATQTDGTLFGQQAINQEASRVQVFSQRIAVVRKGNGYDAFAQYVRYAAKRKTGLRLSTLVQYHIGLGFPAISGGQHLDPAGRVKNTTGNFVD